jgi:hypothetical protein
MPKLTVDFSVPINVLIRDDGTKQALVAIAFYRGEAGSYAGPVREALAKYAREFRAGLGEAEAKRYDEILANVQTSDAYRKCLRQPKRGQS